MKGPFVLEPDILGTKITRASFVVFEPFRSITGALNGQSVPMGREPVTLSPATGVFLSFISGICVISVASVLGYAPTRCVMFHVMTSRVKWCQAA